MRTKGIIFIFLCLLSLGQVIGGEHAVEVTAATPRQTYLTHKDSVLGFYNNLKFSLIDVRDWFELIVNKKDIQGQSLPEGFTPFYAEVKNTVDAMVEIGQEWGLGLGHFSEQDAGLLARMQKQLEKTGQFKIELAQIAQILRVSAAPELASFAQSKVSELTLRNSDLQNAILAMFEYRNSLLPNLSSLFGDDLIMTDRSFNNIVLSQIKLTATGVPDRNYVLLSVMGDDFASIPPKMKQELQEIVTLYKTKHNNKGTRHLKKMLRHLRKERGTIKANMLINYIIRGQFSFDMTEQNFEILKARDLFDRIKTKRDYMNNLQKQLGICTSFDSPCTEQEIKTLDAEFKNHRASLVTLYSRFQEQYLRMFEMYESLKDLMPQYLYLHDVIKRKIEKGRVHFF